MALLIKKSGAQGLTDAELWYTPVSGLSDFAAVTATSAVFTGIGSAMVAGKLYILSGSTDMWFRQGGPGVVAAKAAGSTFVARGVQIFVDGAQGSVIAVLADSIAGNASLAQVDA